MYIEAALGEKRKLLPRSKDARDSCGGESSRTPTVTRSCDLKKKEKERKKGATEREEEKASEVLNSSNYGTSVVGSV